ncbi:UNC5C-like protein [Mytilus edulis]|uniref:UNC5C-like protein n=1 Tax=Mytilus edulis TaxID=6550 RepID=UPI0039EFEA76
MSPEIVSAIVIAVLAILLCIGIISFLIFLCFKFVHHHKRLNDLEEQLDKLKTQVSAVTKQDEYTILNESKLRHKEPIHDSAIELRGASGNSSDNAQPTSGHSSLSSFIGPRYTIKIRKETAKYVRKEITNVYGNVLPDSQVVAIAQRYYKEKTNSSDLVGIDDMDITNQKEEKEIINTRQSVILEGRPTSMMMDLDELPDSNRLNEQGVFVHKMIGKSGGDLQLLGIKLEIPNGALKNNTQITLGITWDISAYPELTKSQALLSPVVVCQPSIDFEKPVRLSFPHCAVNHELHWKLTVLCNKSNLHGNDSAWNEIEQNGVHKMEITEHHVVLFLKHFTLYTLAGESVEGKTAAKAVKLLAFTSRFQMDQMFTVRIYCINNYIDESSPEMMTIIKATKDMKEADAPQPLFIHDNGEDVVVELAKLSNGWENDGLTSKTIDFESIWHCLAPNCKYLFHPTEMSSTKIVCDFTYYQPSDKELQPKKRTLKIADEYKDQSSLALKRNLTKDRKQMKSLILKLDPKSDMDYTMLAEKIGYQPEEIRWLEEQKGLKSPTEIILQKWIDDGHQLIDLEHYFSDMEREDCVSVLCVKGAQHKQ